MSGPGAQVSCAVFGTLQDLFTSTNRLKALAEQGELALLPGPGPVITDPVDTIDRSIGARLRRLDDVRELRRRNVTSVEAVTDHIYGDVDAARRPAEEQAISAYLEHVRD
jgi:hypothetical protein